MKKTFKLLSLIAVFVAIMFIRNYSFAADATSTTGIIFPVEQQAKTTRTDNGNTVTLKLEDASFYQDINTVDSNLKNAIMGDEATHTPSGVIGYIPVPDDFATKYKTALYYEYYSKGTPNETKSPSNNVIFVDENLEQLAMSAADGLLHFENAKYMRFVIGGIAHVANTDTDVLIDSNKTYGIIYVDKDGNQSEPIEYNIKLETKASLKNLSVRLYSDAMSNYIYNPSTSTTATQLFAEKGKNHKIVVEKVNINYTTENITNKAKITFEDPNIATVDDNGNITIHKVGITNITVEYDGVSVTAPIRIAPPFYYLTDLTDEQTTDLCDYIRYTDSDYIGIAFAKDTILPAEIIKAVKEANQTLDVALYNDSLSYAWYFDSKTITDTSMDVNLKISAVDCFVNELTDNKNANLFLDFAHSGKLPGKTLITIFPNFEEDIVEDYYPDESLYYYNEETKKCEFASVVKVSTNYYKEFYLDHCSKYVLAEEELEGDFVEKNPSNTQSSVAPEANKPADQVVGSTQAPSADANANTNANANNNNTPVKNNNTTTSSKLDAEPKTGNTSLLVICYFLVLVSLSGIVICKFKN